MATGLTSLGFTAGDVLTNAQPIVTLIGPILAFVIGIPVAFMIARKTRNLFTSSR